MKASGRVDVILVGRESMQASTERILRRFCGFAGRQRHRVIQPVSGRRSGRRQRCETELYGSQCDPTRRLRLGASSGSVRKALLHCSLCVSQTSRLCLGVIPFCLRHSTVGILCSHALFLADHHWGLSRICTLPTRGCRLQCAAWVHGPRSSRSQS